MLTAKMRQIEQAEGKPIREVLADMYECYGNQVSVASQLGVSPSTLSWWLVRLNLQHWTIIKSTTEGAQNARHT